MTPTPNLTTWECPRCHSIHTWLVTTCGCLPQWERDEPQKKKGQTMGESIEGLGLTVREKHWNELDIEGKIERCREQIKSQQYVIDELRASVRKLEKHDHLNGTIVTPAFDPRDFGGKVGSLHNLNEYF